MPPGAVLFSIFLTVWVPFAYALYKACEWRWWMSGIRFGDVRFESKLTTGALIGLYWKVIGWTWLILLALMLWVGVIFGAVFRSVGGQGAAPEALAGAFQSPFILALIVVGYIGCALAFGVVVRMYLRRDLWARIVASTVIYNLAAADNVTARGEAANALGEGFADSFDIGGF